MANNQKQGATKMQGFRDFIRNPAGVATIFLLISGLISIVLFSASKGTDFTSFMEFLGISAAITLASLLIGSLVGFIFGIPKIAQIDTDNFVNNSVFTPNTNLEQISDWLTKILVGVGLTQIGKIPGAIKYLSEGVGQAYTGDTSSAIFSGSIILYYLIGGFIIGFVSTRIYLREAFESVEDVSRIKAELRKEMKKASTEKDRWDAKAISLVNFQLDPDRTADALSAEDIKEMQTAIKNCSRKTRADVYEKARIVRSNTWRDNKAWMVKTIPVFEALVAKDEEGKYHNSRGQLGFAFKDKENPSLEDYTKARDYLDAAIEIRGTSAERFLFYEFNRAICNIYLDQDFKAGKPTSDAWLRQKIADDIQVVKVSHYWDKIKEDVEAFEDTPIAPWLELNELPSFFELS